MPKRLPANLSKMGKNARKERVTVSETNSNQSHSTKDNSDNQSGASGSESEMKTRGSSKKRTPRPNSSSKKHQNSVAQVSENSRASRKSSTIRRKSDDDNSELSPSEHSDPELSSEEEEDEDLEIVPEPKRSTGKASSSAQVVQKLQKKFDDDHKMSKKTISKLEKDYANLKQENQQNVEDYNELLQQYNELEAVHQELKAKYHDTLSTTTGKKKSSEDKNDYMVKQIEAVMKRTKWRTIKFVGNDAQLLQAATQCLDHLNMKDYMHKDGETEARAALVDQRRDEWVSLYGTDVRHAINEQRSYVQSEQKKLALLRLKGSEKLGLEKQDLPTMAALWQVVRRNLDSEDEEQIKKNEELFDWWLDHVGVCAGNTYFGKKIRRTQNVSTAVCPSDGKLCVPPSTEAMAFLMIENCRKKWIEMHKWREVEGNTGDIPKYSKKHPNTHRFKSEYSDSASGQSPYGGWGSDGIKRFNELKKAIGDMRKNEPERLEAVESAAVQRLHDKAVAERKKKLQENGQDVPEDAVVLTTKKRKRKSGNEEVVLTVNDEE